MSEFIGKKDLARILGVSTRSIERYIKLTGIHPTIPGWHGHRWSDPDAKRFIDAVADLWRQRGIKPMPQNA
jgi:hypothetical protein